ncbi:hypothetical protein ACROYT_G013944 [Oculina patagonica]
MVIAHSDFLRNWREGGSEDICFVSCQKSPEDTSPSSVGSLFKSSMGVLDHQQANVTITCDDVFSKKEDGASFSPADVTVQMKSPDVQFRNASPTNGDSHFTPRTGKQELYAGFGVFISCVELHTILARTVGKPQDLLGQLVSYFFDDQTLTRSVPLQGIRSKQKNVLDQRIVHAIMVYAQKCNSLWVKEERMSNKVRLAADNPK